MAPTRTRASSPPPPKTLDQDEAQQHFAVLYYGLNGTGKTTDLAYMAHLGPVAYIRADRSIRARPLREQGVPISNIELIDELDTEALVRQLRSFRQRLEEDPESLAGLCLDTITELIARRMESIVDDEWRRYLVNMKSRREEPDKSKRYFVDMNYWQPITQELRRWTRQAKDLRCHVAISAQVRRDQDSNGAVQYGPSMNPALQPDVLAYMDFVINTRAEGLWPGTDESVFVGYTRHLDLWMGKDREHVLPSRIVEPTFDRVVAYAKGELKLEDDERQAAYRDLIKRRKKARPKDDLDDDDLDE